MPKKRSGNTSGRGQRDLTIKVKTARGRRSSSTRWLQRQLNDPYVQRAQAEGFRGRAAFKIMEIDDKFRFLINGARVVDLGCARFVGVDLQEVEPLAGAEFHVLDFLDEGADTQVKEWLDGEADVVMSDMAASSSGHKQTDHLRIMHLCETAAYFAFDVLAEGGTFVAKVLAGGAEGDLQKVLKQNFTKVSYMKPPSSRSDSSEKFVVATGFRGRSGDA